MTRRMTLILSVLSLLAFATGPTWAIQYTITNLGSLGGEGNTKPHDINKFGEVTGESRASDGYGGTYVRAFVWDPVSGTMTDLGTGTYPTNWKFYGTGINDSGTVLGQMGMDGDAQHGVNGVNRGFLWSSGSAVTDPIPTMYRYMTEKINNSGAFVGEKWFDSESFAADVAFFHSNGVTTELNTMGGYYQAVSTDINNNGFSVGHGYQSYANPVYVPFRYDSTAGTITHLDSIINGHTKAKAINDHQWIVGERQGSTYYNGFLYDGTTTVDMPNINPKDLNNFGQVVGEYKAYQGEWQQACLWQNGSWTKLYDLLDATDQAGWAWIASATAINDSGQIVGWGRDSDDNVRAFLMTPKRLSGDANSDGSVNGTDLNTVLSNYNQSGMAWFEGDFNSDRSVNGTDLNAVLSNYNQTLPSSTASVPEPSTWLLVILGIVGVLAWRRR